MRKANASINLKCHLRFQVGFVKVRSAAVHGAFQINSENRLASAAVESAGRRAAVS